MVAKLFVCVHVCALFTFLIYLKGDEITKYIHIIHKYVVLHYDYLFDQTVIFVLFVEFCVTKFLAFSINSCIGVYHFMNHTHSAVVWMDSYNKIVLEKHFVL